MRLRRSYLTLPVNTLLIGLLLSLGVVSGCGSSGATALAVVSSRERTTMVEPASEPTGSELFPEDDGYACAIFFGADTRGSLKDCGCPKHRQGGLTWRMGYSGAFARRSRGTPTLQVDAGYFFSDARDAGGQFYRHAEVQNEWVLKAYGQMNFAVANLTVHDVPYAERLFEKAAYEKRGESTPMLGNLISANVRARRPGYASPPPAVIRQVSGGRIPGGKKLRVGFVGLTDSAGAEEASSVFAIDDPLAAARRIVPRVRRQCDVLVVLAYLPPAAAEELARRVSDIDLIINANRIRGQREPVRIHRTTIAYARYQTRSLGEALIYLDESGRLADIRARSVPLDDAAPRDATAEELVARAEAEISRAKRELLPSRRPKTN